MNAIKKLSGLIFLFLSINSIAQTFDKVDYEIYSKILDEFLEKETKKSKLIVIIQESDSSFSCKFISDSLINIYCADLAKNNRTMTLFKDRFTLIKHKTIVITEGDFRKTIMDENGDIYYERLYKKYPNALGVVTISNPYYITDRKTGILYITLVRDGLWGAGYIIYFDITKKKPIVKKYQKWIA